MSGLHSRNKGKRGEREVAAAFRSVMVGFDIKRSVGQSRDGSENPDVQGVPCFWIESKRMKRPNIPQALKQAERECGGRPLWPVAVTRADREEAIVSMRLPDFLDLMKEWWEGKYHVPPMSHVVDTEGGVP